MPRSILIVEDQTAHSDDLRRFLSPEYDCVAARDGAAALAAARGREFVAALVDLHLGAGMDGFEVIARLREIDPRIAVIVVTGDDAEESVRRARDLDVQDYIHKSVGADELKHAVRRSLILRRVTERVRRLEAESETDDAPVAVSEAMKRVVREIDRAARHNAPLLITGGVGAGKMIVARRIHALGRPGRPLERVHCATLDTGDLADSQLFGYEPGAHSTARSRFIGAFERAEDGTLLLDDIDYLPLRVQAKLLQPLEERIVRRLPGSVEVPVRCRVIATSNKDLDACAAAGAFQPDLLSRLRGAQEIRVPGIGERVEDLAGLVQAFVARTAREMGRRAPEVTAEFLGAVRARRWADARQLSNAVRCAAGVCEGERLLPELLPGLPERQASGPDAAAAPEGTLDAILEQTRALAVRRALERAGGDKKAAAADLGITVQWLNAILRGGER
jgi:DNA-binding NtrC family response regulator